MKKNLQVAVYALLLIGATTILSSCGRDCYPGSPDPACGYYNPYNQYPNNQYPNGYNPNQYPNQQYPNGYNPYQYPNQYPAGYNPYQYPNQYPNQYPTQGGWYFDPVSGQWVYTG